jgi:hypothetical protein
MRAPNAAVEVQMDSESTEEFQERVEGRLARIAQQSMRLCAAGYACALKPTDRQRSRREICTRILTALSDEPSSELILAGGSWETVGVEGQRRSQLIELWGELSIQVPGKLMSVRFEDPPSESGVFRAAEKLSPPDSTRSYDETESSQSAEPGDSPSR